MNLKMLSSMEEISAALKSSNAKKQNLRKAFDRSQPYLSTLLQWSDLEQYIDLEQSKLQQQFEELQSVVRRELKKFSMKMDGPGLRSFIMDNPQKLPAATREDAAYALRFAPDPAKLVLDALQGGQGFYPLKSKRDKHGKFGAIRRTCVLLLEGLAVVHPQIKPDVQKHAKKLANDWKAMVTTQTDDQLEALVFLQLLASYGLASEFDVNQLLHLLVSIARRRQAVDLFKDLGFQDKISEFVEKLSSKGKHIDAVKFIYAFEVVDKFPPVPLLEAYLKESKKVAEDVLKKGNKSVQSQNEAIAKETAYLKAIIKCIEEHKLEAEYPRESIDKRIEQLEKQKPEKKGSATVFSQSQQRQSEYKPEKKRPATVFSQSQQRQSEYKRPRVAGLDPDDLANVGSMQYRLQPPKLFGEHVNQYLNSTSHYSLAGTAPNFPPYTSAAAGVGSSGVGVGVGVGAGAGAGAGANSHIYSSQQDTPSLLYDRSKRFGGYGLSDYSSPSFF